MLRISWVAAQLAASQEGLSSMSEWVSMYIIVAERNRGKDFSICPRKLINLSVCFSKIHDMKTYEGVEVQLLRLLILAKCGDMRSASCPCRFTPGTHGIGDWVGFSAPLDHAEKRYIFFFLSGNKPRSLGCSVHSNSLYRRDILTTYTHIPWRCSSVWVKCSLSNNVLKL
jgi:hypothetical protein